jgi:hypothetical protein
MRWSTAIMSALLLIASRVSGVAQERLRPLVRQVDHILLETAETRSLFDFFTRELQLPVAWPLADSPGFQSGGVGAGNVNLEIFRFAVPKRGTAGPQSRFLGLAFQPYPLSTSLAGLDARGLRHEPPQHYVSTLPNGKQGALWTTVMLPELSNPEMSVFLCEYSPEYLNVEVRRKQLVGELALKKGGTLGIEAVKEIVIGTTHLNKDRSGWRKLFQPAAASDDIVWRAGDGPAIRLVTSGKPGIRRIILKVKSLVRAKETLRVRHWLGSVTADAVAIDPRAVRGLGIWLSEK